MLGLEFPPINEILRWQDLWPSFNKIALIAVAATLIGITLFLLASRKDPLAAPKGSRNLAEVIIEFIEESIVMQTLGKKGLGWTPFLLSLFIFIFLCNIPGVGVLQSATFGIRHDHRIEAFIEHRPCTIVSHVEKPFE